MAHLQEEVAKLSATSKKNVEKKAETAPTLPQTTPPKLPPTRSQQPAAPTPEPVPVLVAVPTPEPAPTQSDDEDFVCERYKINPKNMRVCRDCGKDRATHRLAEKRKKEKEQGAAPPSLLEQEKAFKSAAGMAAKRRSEQSTGTTVSNITKGKPKSFKKPKQSGETARRWRAGDACFALYAEDGLLYEAKVEFTENLRSRCYINWNDFEESSYVLLKDIYRPNDLPKDTPNETPKDTPNETPKELTEKNVSTHNAENAEKDAPSKDGGDNNNGPPPLPAKPPKPDGDGDSDGDSKGRAIACVLCCMLLCWLVDGLMLIDAPHRLS